MPYLDLGPMMTPIPIGLRAAHVYLREQDVCVWNPSPAIWLHDLDRVNRLIAAGYEQIPEDSGPLLAMLHGQMAQILTLMVKGPGIEHSYRWVHHAERERAEAMPVALAFYVPHTVPADDDAYRFVVHRWAERLPPPGFGERAIVWRDDGWQTRSIEQLDSGAIELQARMAAKLRELVAPSDWYEWSPELDACHNPENYRRMRQNLHSELLRKRGYEREQVRQQLMRLDTLRNQALAIEALQDRREREGDTWMQGVQEVIEMAQELAAQYWAAEQRAALPAVAKRTLPDIPNAFDGDKMAAIPSMMPVQTILNGYSAAVRNGWVADDDGIPTYRQATSEHDTTLQVRGADGDTVLTDLALHDLWAQVREYSDLDGDVFLAMMAQAMISPNDPDGVWITGSQILDYRGVRPKTTRDENGHMRRAGHRQEDLLDVAKCVARQGNQWVRIRSMIADETTATKRGKKPQKKLYTHESKLTLISEVIRQHELVPAPDGQRTPSLPDNL
jgi:hypothetical protein